MINQCFIFWKFNEKFENLKLNITKIIMKIFYSYLKKLTLRAILTRRKFLILLYCIDIQIITMF
jgi:hypothetical protein